ncbi:MAG: hypothetical protein [Bacteriophage sp.]|nr:MAG: hypothetical protein [Bacteriophage sp.]
MHHELKIAECYYVPGLSGEKPFEIRRNDDRGFQKGDTVLFREVNKLNLSAVQGRDHLRDRFRAERRLRGFWLSLRRIATSNSN